MSKKALFIIVPISLLGILVLTGNESELNNEGNLENETKKSYVAIAKKAKDINLNADHIETVQADQKPGIEAKDLDRSVPNHDVKIIEATDISYMISESFLDLKNKADSGDIESAVVLGKSLQICSILPKTLEEYDQHMSRDLSTPIDVLELEFERCKGITDEHLALATKYLEDAAKEGHLEAKLEFFKAGPLHIKGLDENYEPQTLSAITELKEFNQKRLSYIEEALEAGSSDAALALGMSYTNPWIPKDSAISPTGYDLKQGVKYLQIAKLMDPTQSKVMDFILEDLRPQISVYEFESAINDANHFFSEKLADKKVTKLKYRPNPGTPI